jgi:23S rRNA (cytidine1920-2'-O)/16S rRNA (cytidine1409-2'-O)-methyltransferase
MTPHAERRRLDEELVVRGLLQTRARARDAILRGTVLVNGQKISKPAASVAITDNVTLNDPAAEWVSRAALKLLAGLEAFDVDPSGKIALDIGASTGGFTQVLLKRGAAKIYAIDVGHGQLSPQLASDPCVVVREGLNARDLTIGDLEGEHPEMIVCDTSFISLTLVLPPALALAAPGALGVFLVKPQFEAGRDAIGKGGILKNPADGPIIAERLSNWVNTQPGWRSLGYVSSPIIGGDGNHEYLLGGVKNA